MEAHFRVGMGPKEGGTLNANGFVAKGRPFRRASNNADVSGHCRIPNLKRLLIIQQDAVRRPFHILILL